MPESSPRRGSPAFWLALAATLALLPLGYLFFLRAPPAPPPAPAGPDAAALAPPEAAPPRAADLHIAELSGTVEVRSGGGAYRPALLGTVLRADDALRTADGRARLVARDAYDVQVEPGTELEVQELTERLSRFRLGLGMLVARVEGGSGRRIEVAARGSDAVAASADGTFAVSNNGAGTVATGARSGEVELRAAGKAVILRSGQQSLVQPGQAPSEPEAVPASLFLKIDWPSDKELNRRDLALSGRTAPGAVLLVAGTPVRVERDGRFRAAVRLREGRNAVAVEGADVGGHRSQSRGDLAVDTTAPDSDIATQKLWNP